MWVLNGSQLATTATLLFLASVGDARGARRLYLSGSLLFTFAALGCAFAPSFGVLIAMRVLQGLAGSAMIVTTQTLNRALFPPAQLGRAIAVNSIFVAVGTAAGPTIGGIVLAFADWRWIFGLTVPLGTLALTIGLRSLPRIAASGAPLDLRSAVFAAAGCAGAVAALDGVARGDGVAQLSAVALAAAAATAVFVRRQLRLEHPLLAVELFRDRAFSFAVAASAATYAAQSLAYVALPFYFQSVLGRSPLAAGLLMSAWPLATLVTAWRMGPLSDRYPATVLCPIGIAVMGVGIGGFALLPAHPATLAIVACAAVAGAGFGTFQTPNNRALIAAAPPEKTGRASGVMAIARLSGQTTGAALVAIVFALAAPAAAGAPSRASIEAVLVTACGFIAFATLASYIRRRTPSWS